MRQRTVKNSVSSKCAKREHRNNFSQQTTILIFWHSKQSPTDKLLNAYEMKETARACAAVEFPKKPTWLAAIKNKHYASWVGLNVSSVAKRFPESEETLKGHGRKIKSGLGSTKLAIANESDGQLTNSIQKKENFIFVKT